MLIRFILLVLIIAGGIAVYDTFNPHDMTKESMQEAFKKEKTINTVQKTREKRRLEAEKIMDQF